MRKIFSFCNQKGGVGKTTSAVNIATTLAQHGSKVLIVDADAQANTTSGLGEEKPSIVFTTFQLLIDNADPNSIIKKTKIENLFLIPSNADLSGAELELTNKLAREFQLKNKISKISDDFDFIFIDCPPSIGLITINALVASDYIIIPLQCEYYALEGLGQLIQSFELVKQNINKELEIGGVILTMADFRTNLTQQVIEEVKNYFKNKVFEAVIPRSVKLSEAPSFGQPAVIYDPQNRGSKAYLEAGKEFLRRFSRKRFDFIGAGSKQQINAEIKEEEPREELGEGIEEMENTETVSNEVGSNNEEATS